MANYGTLSVLVRADTSGLARSLRGDATSAGTDYGHRFNAGLKKAIKIGAVGVAAGLGAIFKVGLDEQRDYQTGLSQLQAGLKSTGGVSNTTVKGMENLASSIQAYSGQTDDSIVASEQLLLTFPQIRNEAGRNNDIFNQTVKVTADMAQRLGKDAPSSAIMLGKALNDPVKGATALRRVGVQLSDQQVTMVKHFVATGDTMKAQKIILGELNTEFGGSARAYGQTMPGQIDRAKRAFEDTSQALIQQLMPILTKLADWVTKTGLPAFQRFTQWLGPRLVGAINLASKVLSVLFGFVSRHTTAFKVLASAIVAVVAAYEGYRAVTGVMNAVKAAQQAYTLATYGMAAAENAGKAARLGAMLGTVKDIALKISHTAVTVAGTVATWAATAATTAFGIAVQIATSPVTLIILAIAALVVGIILLIKHWKSVWGVIQTAARWAWQHVLKPVFDGIKVAIRAVASVFTWLWQKVILPVWAGIRKAFQLYWRFYVHPIFTAISAAIRVVASVFRWLWHKAIQPVWNGIRVALKTGWQIIKRVVFDPIHAAINALGTVFRWLWHKVIEPVWNGIKNAIMWPWNHVIKPVLEAFRKFPSHLGDAWRAFKTTIGTIFNNIKKAVGTPIYFVASKILRPIIKGINFLITKIGLGPIPVDWIESIPHFAHGGKVPGQGNGDTVPAMLTPGEWVLTKRQAKAIGYGTLRGLPHYQEGGLVGPGGPGLPIMPFFDWNPIHHITGAAKSLWHMGKEIVDEAGKALRWAAYQGFKTMTKPLVKMATPYAQMKVPPGNVMWKFIGKMMLTTIQKALDFVRGHSESEKQSRAALVGGMSGSPGSVPTSEKGIWIGLRRIGFPAVQTAGIMGNIQDESGFNPFRVQAGYGPYQSMNPAAAGAGGYGLVQWTPGSKLTAVLGGRPNTLANQLWAIAAQLRGQTASPEGAAGRALMATTTPSAAANVFGLQYERYSTGDARTTSSAINAEAIYRRFKGLKFDQGGLLPVGASVAVNTTRKPEPILTGAQWDALTAKRSGPSYIAGGSLDIGIDSQGRMRAWVQDVVLDEADYSAATTRMGGGRW